MGSIVDIEFHGDRLQGVEDARGSLVYLKPVAESMGLDWSGQLQRLKRDPILREGMVVMPIPPALGGDNAAVFLELTLFHGWLFKVQPARVKAEKRAKLLTYQREAYGVLARAFTPHHGPDAIAMMATAPAAPQPTTALPTTEARTLVAECRKTFGQIQARELWFDLNLPRTASMARVPTIDLFANAASRTGGQA